MVAKSGSSCFQIIYTKPHVGISRWYPPKVAQGLEDVQRRIPKGRNSPVKRMFTQSLDGLSCIRLVCAVNEHIFAQSTASGSVLFLPTLRVKLWLHSEYNFFPLLDPGRRPPDSCAAVLDCCAAFRTLQYIILDTAILTH